MGQQKLWPIHPQPLPDELLSSWMIRLAWGNGFKVHSFYAAHFGRYRQIWNRDIDHHAPTWLLEGLASHSGVKLARIESMTLRAYESVVFEKFNEYGNTRFLMPLGISHRIRKGNGQQFCSVCLSTDAVPYLRRRWRLSLAAACTLHGVLLQDRCGHCGWPLTPHRVDMNVKSAFPVRNSILQCSRCRLSVVDKKFLSCKEDIEIQKHIDQVLDFGYVKIQDNNSVYSHLYFDGLRRLMNGLVILGSPDVRRCSFDRAIAKDRLQRIAAAVILTKCWPTQFLEFCNKIKRTYAAFNNDPAVSPYWLASVLRQEILLKRAPLLFDEAESIAAAALNITGKDDIRSARRLSGRCVDQVMCRPSVGHDTADLLIASLDQKIGRAEGIRQFLLQRDKVMFIAARCMHLSIPKLLKVQFSITNEIDAVDFSFWDRIGSYDRAVCMLGWYASLVKSQIPKQAVGSALFISQYGAAIKPNAVSARFNEAVRESDLHRSITSWNHWVRAVSN